MTQEVLDTINRVFGRQGGYMDLDRLHYEMRKFDEGNKYESALADEAQFDRTVLEECTDLVEYHLGRYVNPPKVHLSYLHNLNLGAIATKDRASGDAFIGLNYGCITVLRSLFSRMLSNPNIFLWCGDTSIEETIEVDNPFLINTYTVVEFLNSNPNLRVSPNDSKRLWASKAMVKYAVQFLAMHELGHIVRGHIECMRSVQQSTSDYSFVDGAFDAMSLSEQAAQSNLWRQALEYDTDQFAVWHGLRSSYRLYKLEKSEDRKQAAELWIVAILSIFRIMGLLPYSKEDLKNLHHPPAGMRMVMLVNGIIKQVQRIGPNIFDREITIKEAKDFVGVCINTAERGFVEGCIDREILTQGSEAIYAAMLEEGHLIKVHEALDKIWPTIQEHKLQFVNP